MGVVENKAGREHRRIGIRWPPLASCRFGSRHGLWPILAGMIACGPSALDVYLEGQKKLGQAERGSCKLVYDRDERSHVINSSRIYTCLNEVRRAYDRMVEGQTKGYSGLDVDRTIAKVKDDIERLESMYRMVSKMEMDRKLDD